MEYKASEYMAQREVVTLNPVVTIFEAGVGAIEPTDQHTEQEVILAIAEAQKPIQDTAVVCIDEREALEPQPVRAKMAGGNTVTGYVAALLGDWSLFTEAERVGGSTTQYDAVTDYLQKAGHKIGGHSDNHAHGERTGCGASDNLPKIISDVAAHGNEGVFVKLAQEALGEHFNEADWLRVTIKASEIMRQNRLDDWRSSHAQQKLDESGTTEVLNGGTDSDRDPNNSRHNHWGEAIHVNAEPGVSNDRDTAKIPFFQVDLPAVVSLVQTMSKDEAEFSRLLHAATAYQIGTAYRLTKNMRIVR